LLSQNRAKQKGFLLESEPSQAEGGFQKRKWEKKMVCGRKTFYGFVLLVVILLLNALILAVRAPRTRTAAPARPKFHFIKPLRKISPFDPLLMPKGMMGKLPVGVGLGDPEKKEEEGEQANVTGLKRKHWRNTGGRVYRPPPTFPCAADDLIAQNPVDLTIVMATRVDSYGGAKSFERMQWKLDMIDYYAEKAFREGSSVELEIIIVEYNPVPGEKRLRDVIRIPKFVYKFRIIEVSNRYHRQVCRQFWFSHYYVVPVMEFVAKNIGIRRANGEFILPMAMDTILVRFFIIFFLLLFLHLTEQNNSRLVSGICCMRGD
jgi:hypothetical protein